jgi:eukaryotic-like serine/threonine-protein kinase
VSALLDLARWPHADELIEQALALPVAERAAFVERTAGGDVDLALALAAVLREADAADGFLSPGAPLDGALGEELRRELLAEDEADHAHALSPGTRLGDYEIAGVLGRGGMGEVYRARDLRLEREVAIKVLPERFAESPERVARFRREARLLASLNHPNVGAIYGVAEQNTVEALVLELVDGPTLAERIASGPIPPREAVAIARQIVEALDAAHRLGIVHRDLKPANIKLTPHGKAKVLDFGLARVVALDTVPGSGAGGTDLTAVGDRALVLGTVAYMSPEQTRGLQVDQRADIWAFGCVLFEMLTGERAFRGTSVGEILAGVLDREPDFTKLPAAIPRSLRRLLKRCLEKDPRRRLGYIGDALADLDGALSGATVPVAPTGRARRPRAWHLAAVILVVAAVVAVVFVQRSPQGPDTSRVMRLAVPLASGDELVTGAHPVAALSPDGRMLVYRARRNETIRLFRRSLGQLESEAIPGSENAASPFFSPDGRWLGFDADGVLKKMPAAGGPAVAIARAPGGITAGWADDGHIVFATPVSRVLHRISGDGGEPQPVSVLNEERGELLHNHPFPLPGGRVVLFTIVRPDARDVAALRLDTREVRILTAGMQPRLLPTGHLLFARDDALWAAPFDAVALTLKREPLPVLEGLHNNDIVYFTTAADGSLAYVPRRAPSTGRTLQWIDRNGGSSPLPLGPRPYLRAALSPDGSRIALAMDDDDNNTDVWIAHLARGTLTRLTSHATVDTAPLWSPDGRFIVFRSERDGGGLFRRAADSTGESERITRSDGPFQTPYSWSPDGRELLFSELSGYRLQRIRSVSLETREVRTLLEGEFAQLRPRVSPDGRWLAYQSDESGRFEVYVRPYPGLQAARWQVSTSGGTSPKWSPDGRELFYYDGAAVVSVRVGAGGSTFSAEAFQALFEFRPFMGRMGPDFDVSPDGRRFLMLQDAPPTDPVARRAQLVLVQNWFDELRARMR